MRTGSLYFNESEYEEAANEFKSVLDQSQDPKEKGKAAFYLAESTFLLKKYTDASKAYIQYLKNYKDDEKRPVGQFRVSECFYFLNDYSKASKAYSRFINENPGHELLVEAYYSMAGSLLEIAKFDDALNAYQTLINENPSHRLVEPSKYYIGWVYYRNNQFEKAASEFESFFKSYSNSKFSIESLLRAADARFRLNQFEIALTNYNGVLRNGEGKYEKEAKLGIAWSYYKSKEFGKASSYFLSIARGVVEIPAKAEAYYQSIQSYFSGQDYHNGLKISNELIKQCSSHALVGDAHYWAGYFQKKLNQPELAEKSFQNALNTKRVKVSDAEISLELGAVYIQLKKYDSALKLYSKALAQTNKPDILNQLNYDYSRALYKTGKVDQAIQVARKVNVKEGDLATVSKISLAEFYFAKKEYERAIGLYLKVLESKSKSSLKRNALYRLGWSYKLLGQTEKAINTFSKMNLDLDLKYSRELIYLVAGLYYELGKGEESIRWYQQLTQQLGAYSADSYLALANMAFDKEDFKRVREYLFTFLRVMPKEKLVDEAQFLLAEASYELKDQKQALKSYSDIIKIEKSSVRENALYGRAWLYYELGQNDEAIKDLELLIKSYPKSQFKASAIQLKGKIFMSSNQVDKAIDAYQEGIKSAGKGEDTELMLINLANAETERKQYDKALTLYDQFINQFSQSKRIERVLYEKGWILMQKGDLDRADRVFKDYKNRFSKGKHISDTVFALGEIAYGRKKYDESLAYYKQCGVSHKDKAYYKSGWAYYKLEKYNESAMLFKKLVEECADSSIRVESMYRAGASFIKANQFEKAASILTRYLNGGKGDRYYGVAIYKLATVQEKLSKVEKAKDLYETYLKLYPKGDQSGEVNFRMGKLLFVGKNYILSRDYFRKVLEDKTHFLAIESQFSVGETYYAEEKYKEANREYLKTLLYKDGKKWQAASLYKIGLGHKALDNKEKAKSYLDKLIRRYPNFDESKQAVEILQGL